MAQLLWWGKPSEICEKCDCEESFLGQGGMAELAKNPLIAVIEFTYSFEQQLNELAAWLP